MIILRLPFIGLLKYFIRIIIVKMVMMIQTCIFN